MQKLTAITVIVCILVASAGELAHACATDVPPQSVESVIADMPCHGEEQPSSGESMDCCDDPTSTAGVCVDCLCTAVSMPLTALEADAVQAVPGPVQHRMPLSAAPPPERPPEFLLRPPIVLG